MACTFNFKYADGSNSLFENIKTVKFYRSLDITVCENELLSYCFPLGYDLHLFSDDSNVTVSGKELRHIEITE